MKKFLIALAAVLFLFSGLAFAATPVKNAAYSLKNSNQFNCGNLCVLKQDNIVVFSLSLMRGNETKGVKEINIAGSGILEKIEKTSMAKCFVDEEQEITIKWHADRKHVSIFHKGIFSVDPDGVYELNGSDFDWNENLARVFIESLSPALTSLNSYNRPYRFELGDEPVKNGKFYPAKFIYEKNGSVISEFLLSAEKSPLKVYRVVDGKPELIYGNTKK